MVSAAAGTLPCEPRRTGVVSSLASAAPGVVVLNGGGLRLEGMDLRQEMDDTVEQGFTFRQEGPCPYFSDGRVSTVEFLLPREDEVARFHLFLARGYRRLGQLFYRNVCRGCRDCLPIRVEAGAFRLSRSQKRTLRRNTDLRVEIAPSSISARKVDLYRSYLATKHGNVMTSEESDPEIALSMMHYGYPHVFEMDYFIRRRLVGVGIVDVGADAVSSNYFYYDTSHLDRRLGVVSILHEINLCRLLGKRYCYLGFCIEETNKMSYKKHFRPNQVLRDGVWREFLKA